MSPVPVPVVRCEAITPVTGKERRMHRGAKPAKSKVEAKPPVARKSLKSESSRVHDLEKRLSEALKREAEALDRQTATSEILRVISSSPTDVQPVFDAIARSAVALCGGIAALVLRFDGEMLHVAGHHAMSPEGVERNEQAFPRRPGRDYPPGRAFLDRKVVHVPDLQAATEFAASTARQRGAGSQLAVPLLHGQEAIGVIGLARNVVGPFSAQQIEVLQTFADQAVIAIENVRLFNETKEALEQQMATAEILRVIASSPTDLEPALRAIVESACRVCGGYEASIFLRTGSRLRRMAQQSGSEAVSPEPLSDIPISPDLVNGRAVLERRMVQVSDLSESDEFPAGRERARLLGYRTTVAVPLLLKGEAIGTLAIRRTVVKPFTDARLAVLQTFADQAVIAIENVRLFTETKEALEQQTATSEILRVIASSPTDEQPVFETIVGSALRLLDGHSAGLRILHGDELHISAFTSTTASGDSALAQGPVAVIPVSSSAHFTRVIKDRTPSVVEDTEIDSGVPPEHRLVARARGYRSGLTVPLLRGETVRGLINVTRRAPGPFSADDIALLKTFADQAVIAIENVRLFKELQASNRDLTTALDKQTATSEILRTIAQAQTELQPVFDTIARSAAQLCHAHTTAVFLTDGRTIHHPASYGDSPEALAAIKARFPRPLDRETAAGTAILTRSVIHVPDVQDPSAVEFARQTGRVIGFRSLLSIPMLRQGEAVGAINVTRREPGPFSEAEVALLKTFADQAVIAVENVRLFKELEGANRELSAASQHKSEFLANMSHELRTPLNAIIGFSEVLTERMFGELNEKQDEYLKDIYASGTHLLSLINDILDLSKIEAGRMELELTDFDLPTALDNALMLVRERAGRRGIALEHSVDERLGEIRGDERKVKQVLLNLLSNALKFTSEGGRVEVRAGMVDGMAEISVTDTGVGIAPEDQGAIFEEFRQVGTAEKKAEGTGLGLTLCRKFIELHGGKIWVKSQVSVGSTFTFTIPMRRGE